MSVVTIREGSFSARAMACSRIFFLALALLPCLLMSSLATWAAEDATGPNGVNSDVTGFTGFGVNVGQLEGTRPGLPGFDNAQNSHPDVTPAGVYQLTFGATANRGIDDHPENVAGLIISGNANVNGVAPGANLYSAAFGGDPITN